MEARGGNLFFLQALLSEVELSPASRILEIGCGTGILSEYLSAITGVEVIGTEKCKETAEIASRRIECIYTPDGKAPPHIGRFDLVYCKDVLPEIGDKNDFFRMLRGLTRPRGAFCTYLPDERDYDSKPLFRFLPSGMLSSRVCYGSPSDARRLLLESGFSEVRLVRIPLGTVALDEGYVRRHWDGYFSNSESLAFDGERRAGFTRLMQRFETLSDFGILAHYEWERTMIVAR